MSQEEYQQVPRPPSGPQPPNTSRVPVMPEISPRNISTPRGTATPAGSSRPQTVSISPRLYSSSSARRSDLHTKYVLLQEQEPWGKAVRQDVDKYREEERKRQEIQRNKQEKFRRELANQIQEHEKSKALESTFKEDEMKKEQSLFNTFRELENEEKKVKRGKHLKEIEDRKEHLVITSARREREQQRETYEEGERRKIFEKEKADALDGEMKRRQKQRDYSKEMWEFNLQVKSLKERQQQEEMEHDKALMAEYIRITDDERRKRADFIKSRQRPTNPNLPSSNAQRIKEEKMQKFIESQVKQQEVEANRLQKRFEEDKAKKMQKQFDNEKYLSEQIDARRQARENQRQADLEERRRLDADTAAYREAERDRKSRRFRNTLTYSDDLDKQLSSQREKQLLELVSPCK